MRLQNRCQHIVLLLTFGYFVHACTPVPGAATTTPSPAITATLAPADPALEAQTFTVTRGPIARRIELSGRVVPINLTTLSFRMTGIVSSISVRQGDVVTPGLTLAALVLDDQRDELRLAEDTLTQAERALAHAQTDRERQIADRQRDLARAQANLAALSQSKADTRLQDAERAIETAEREAQLTRNSRSVIKNNAGSELAKATEALIAAQSAYARAKDNYDWVEERGTDPLNPETTNAEGKKVPNRVTEAQRAAYYDAYVRAQSDLRTAEQNVENAKRLYEQAMADEKLAVAEADAVVADKKRTRDAIAREQRSPSAELRAARDALASAQSALTAARDASALDDRQTAVENARRELERRQRKVTDGQLVASEPGVVLALNLTVGEQVTAFAPVMELGDPTALELAAQPSPEQLRQLNVGQAVEIVPISQPDTIIAGQIRRLPASPASGTTLADSDQSLRIALTQPDRLTLNEAVKVRIVLEQKTAVLLLPPEAIRSFEGRQFVVIRSNSNGVVQERRVAVRLGISTESAVEVLSGVAEGDIVVGP